MIGFNPEFFLDVLGVLTDESITFQWGGKATPGKIVEATGAAPPYTRATLCHLTCAHRGDD